MTRSNPVGIYSVDCKMDHCNHVRCVYVVVNFLFQVIFLFLLFLGMVLYANEVETK